jgi:hypothetical protein
VSIIYDADELKQEMHPATDEENGAANMVAPKEGAIGDAKAEHDDKGKLEGDDMV